MDKQYLLDEDHSLLVCAVMLIDDLHLYELHVVLSVLIPVILILRLTWVSLLIFENVLF